MPIHQKLRMVSAFQVLWMSDDENYVQDSGQRAAAARQGAAPSFGADLARVRDLWSKLFVQWSSITSGETLELQYTPPSIPQPPNTAGS